MSLFTDIRYGVRTLGKSPAFTAVAVLSLALGIGASTSIFSLVNAIILRSLPVPNPEELRIIGWSGADWEKWEDKMARMGGVDSANRFLGDSVSLQGFHALREHCAAQADVFGYFPIYHGTTFRARHEAVWTEGLMVSDNFFSGLSVRPLIGRLFDANDERAEAMPAVVISYRLWEQQFGLDPNALGQSVTLGASSFTTVGVLPREFPGVRPGTRTAFYVPLSAEPYFRPRWRSDPDLWWVKPMARLNPGVSEAQFHSAVNVVFMREAQAIQMKEPKLSVTPGRTGQDENREHYEGPLRTLLYVVGVVLLVACGNLAGLFLARGMARQHEFAVRAALGAGRARLVRQSLTESVLVVLLGGGLGLVVAIWGKTALGQLLAESPDGLHYDTSLDLRVLVFTAVVSLGTAVLSGLLPAWRAASVDPLSGLKDRQTLGSPRLRTGRLLVAAQITLSLVLMGIAGLYVRTLVNLTNLNPGYAIDHLLVFRLRPDNIGYERPQAIAFFDRVLESLAAIPGVKSAALIVQRPLTFEGGGSFYKISGGRGVSESRARVDGVLVNETFFSTVAIPLVQGRALQATDDASAAKVAVVNEAFARQYLQGRNPIGLIITDNREKPPLADWQIVGVCGDVKQKHIKRDAIPMVYRSFRQIQTRTANFMLRTVVPPQALTVAARKAVQAVDPNVPLDEVSTLEQVRDASIREERTFAAFCSSLAAFALLLSCIGLYGLMSYQVAHRTSEIGIRQALGATRRQIAVPILREALLLAGIGIAIGTPLTLAFARSIRSSFYGVGPADPVGFCGTAILFLIVALIAAWLPARRAARIDPMVALRSE